MRKRRSFTAALIAAMLTVMGMFAAPGVGQASTSDAYPVTPFYLEYGASVLTGSITWYNRNVNITGSVKARSTGKQARFRGESASCLSPLETRTASVDTTRPFDFGMTCDFPGGFTYVHVALWDVDGSFLDGVTCTRQGC
ncbi:hypothetical protein L6E12_22960 [Actinokineospora sp. PR83]|uniref:hypothetical protein n=1 Tax=Actinokineospora sp. PR83 TaxID=2884908 RepID=UPI001F2F633F|nr:hypothetical protein [Actinokineospora sp. PR83]MCG8918647.1 hypothetical protein [Actinokineospora sp. PR83]